MLEQIVLNNLTFILFGEVSQLFQRNYNCMASKDVHCNSVISQHVLRLLLLMMILLLFAVVVVVVVVVAVAVAAAVVDVVVVVVVYATMLVCYYFNVGVIIYLINYLY